MISILGAVGQWLLKLFLSGLFNKVLAQIEDQAEHTKQAAVETAASSEVAAQTEISIVKSQAAVERAYKAPNPTGDPFGVDKWNKGESS